MPIDTVLQTNQQSVDRVLGAGPPVVLVFWQADSPLPHDVEKLLAERAAAYAGKVLIAKVNVRDEPLLATRFAVTPPPALVLIKGGKTEATLPTSAGVALLEQWLDYLVKGGKRPPMPVQGARPDQAFRSNGNGGKPVVLSDATFDQVVGGPEPVLVDFWAAWCGPCRIIAPTVEQLAGEFQGKAVIAKLNVDENQRTAQRFEVMSIPTLLLFKQGKVVERVVGVQTAAALRQVLGRYVG